MRYRVKWFVPGQQVAIDETVEVADANALRDQYAAQGRLVLSAAPVRALGIFSRERKPDYAIFCREMRTLLRAGMTLVEGVETLSAQSRQRGGSGGLASAILEKLQRGQAFSTVLESLPGAPVVLVAAVRGGERTSNLPEALDAYLRFDGLVSDLRSKTLGAAIYPGLVTALGLAIVVFLLLVVMPSFARMYQNLRGGASSMTALVIRLSTFMDANRGYALLVLGLLCCAIAWSIASGGALRMLGRAADTVPWIRARIQDFHLALAYQGLALLLKGGHAIPQALAIGAASAVSEGTRASMRAALAHVERGASISRALAFAGLCDEIGRRLMAAADRNGEFHLALDAVAHMHSEKFVESVERFTRIVEPLLLLVVALGVGLIVVLMYFPVFDIATRIR